MLGREGLCHACSAAIRDGWWASGGSLWGWGQGVFPFHIQECLLQVSTLLRVGHRRYLCPGVTVGRLSQCAAQTRSTSWAVPCKEAADRLPRAAQTRTRDKGLGMKGTAQSDQFSLGLETVGEDWSVSSKRTE